MAVAGVCACLVCNTAMVAIDSGQLSHPCCDPDDIRIPVVSESAIAELIGDLGQCQDCGQPARSPGLTSRCKSKHKAGRP